MASRYSEWSIIDISLLLDWIRTRQYFAERILSSLKDKSAGADWLVIQSHFIFLEDQSIQIDRFGCFVSSFWWDQSIQDRSVCFVLRFDRINLFKIDQFVSCIGSIGLFRLVDRIDRFPDQSVYYHFCDENSGRGICNNWWNSRKCGS